LPKRITVAELPRSAEWSAAKLGRNPIG
jgi:hypothetical protein